MYPIETYVQPFERLIEAWACDHYYADIRYIANSSGDLFSGRLTLSPIPWADGENTLVRFGDLCAGREHRSVTRDEMLAIAQAYIAGSLQSGAGQLNLPAKQNRGYYSSLIFDRVRWNGPVSLKISTEERCTLTQIDAFHLDNDLRRSNIPFDGLQDLLGWLHLDFSIPSTSQLQLDLIVHPPIELIFGNSGLTNNRLSLTFHAISSIDKSQISLACVFIPTQGRQDRRAVSPTLFTWSQLPDGVAIGEIEVQTTDAQVALVMLSYHGVTVTRQWFADPLKTHNRRSLAMHIMDRDFSKLIAALQGSHSMAFERAICALMFLLNCAPAPVLDDDAPDLLMMTPMGKMVLIECTLKISDLPAKLSKLVQRASTLRKHFESFSLTQQLSAILVCRQPSDEIAKTALDFAQNNVILVTEEGINNWLQACRTNQNPDAMIDAEVEKMLRLQQPGMM